MIFRDDIPPPRELCACGHGRASHNGACRVYTGMKTICRCQGYAPEGTFASTVDAPVSAAEIDEMEVVCMYPGPRESER